MDEVGLEGILDLLSGDSEGVSSLPDRLVADRSAALADRWSRWWQRHPELQDRWGSLPDAHQRRLGEAPELWTLLSVNGDPPLLARWLSAEEALAGWPDAVDAPCWTALGDCYIKKQGQTIEVANQAPRLCTGAIVDWQSPNALGHLIEVAGEAVPFEPDEASAALRKLELACELLQAAAPHWLDLMKRFNTVVLMRKVPSYQGFSSATTRVAIGRPVLRNPSHPDGSPELIADALVHETVHTILDHVELTTPLSPHMDRYPDARIQSGWSGKMLDLNTFVHACLVWFALFHVWLGAVRARATDYDNNIRLLVSRSRGFVGANPTAQLEPYRDALQRGVFELVEEAGRRVTAILNQ